jgi:hypothetical protein
MKPDDVRTSSTRRAPCGRQGASRGGLGAARGDARPARARPWRRGSPDPVPNSEVKPAVAESTAPRGCGRVGCRARAGRMPRAGGPRPFGRGPFSMPGAVRAPVPHGRVRIAALFPCAGPYADPPVRRGPLRACGAYGAVRDPTPGERPGRGRFPDAAARVRGRLRRGSAGPFAHSGLLRALRPDRRAPTRANCLPHARVHALSGLLPLSLRMRGISYIFCSRYLLHSHQITFMHGRTTSSG